jgi:hypothetical protein
LLESALGDPRVASLADQHGLVREVVEDYVIGRVLLGTFDADGTVSWVRDQQAP